jgi:hypothetical protein
MPTVVDAPVTLAAVLRQLADGLDEAAALGVPEVALFVDVQPRTAGDDEATVRAVDVLGWALLGSCGRAQLLSNGTVHYSAARRLGPVSVSVYQQVSVTGPVAQPLRTDAALLTLLDPPGGMS